MRPAYIVLHMEQGATFVKNLTLTDSAGVPVDLTGKTARMQIRDDYTGALILELTTANGRIAALDNTGVVSLRIPAETLADLSVDIDYTTFKYDLELVSVSGLEEIVERPVRGTIVLWKEITV